MKKLFVVTSIALLTSTAFAAEAGKSDTGVDYNEIGAGYTSMEIDSTTYPGFGISATYLLTENFFVNGSYGSVEKSSKTIASTTGSIGYRMPIAANTDAVATIGYGYTTITSAGHLDTYPMSLGIRSAVTPDIDLGADLIYVEKDNSESGFGASIKYKINSNLFASGIYKSLTDSSQYTIGIGYKF